MTTLRWIALILVIIGALNWGLVGLFQFDLVAALFGGTDALLSRIVYTLVGISGVIVAAGAAAMTAPPRREHLPGGTPAGSPR